MRTRKLTSAVRPELCWLAVRRIACKAVVSDGMLVIACDTVYTQSWCRTGSRKILERKMECAMLDGNSHQGGQHTEGTCSSRASQGHSIAHVHGRLSHKVAPLRYC